MATARQEHDWAIASSQMALLAEVNRNVKKRPRPYRPGDFNPMSQSKGTPTKRMISLAHAAKLLGAKIYKVES